uniref:Uncharacterized protein n=1 Tax=Picea sitchensis TaxID=3332 RepID=D5AA53_PICSI|nr:unknown [Picea sitchensis]
MKAELMQLRADNQKMGAIRQEMTAQVQALTQDLVRARADMQQVGAMRAEIESMHQELQRARTAIEYEKKARADQLEQGQAMEKNLISMAREVEKLRAELANADKRGRVAANPGGAYAGNYGGAEMGYSGGAYGDGYGVHPAQGGAESGGQYGAGAAPWGAYKMQRSHVKWT